MTTTTEAMQARLRALHERIARACARAGRGLASVRLVAVSKTFPAEAVIEALRAGQRDFGENHAQEGLQKIADVQALLRPGTPGPGPAPRMSWHFIGPIQSNKTRPIAQRFDWVHAIDREKIARRLSEQRDPGTAPLEVCIQVNVSGEASKSGVEPEELPVLAEQVAVLPRLALRGLMTVPEPTPDQTLQRRRFAQLRGLLEMLNARGMALDTLSMGMSADFEAAILEGATMIRIGTAIFGERHA